MEMSERHAAILGELAELSLSLARDLHAAALAAEEPQAKAQLASTFHKLSRSVRQTLAIEARLKREAVRDDKQARVEAQVEAHAQATRRKDRIEATVSRLIWTESERDEDDNNDLEEQLEGLLYGDLPDLSDAAIIDQLADRLGLKNPPPQGEGDREAVEGVEAHQPLHTPPAATTAAGGFNPLSPSGTAPPEGEHLGAAQDPPPQGEVAAQPTEGVEAHQLPRPRPIGLPGEYGPNGETGEHRRFNNSG